MKNFYLKTPDLYDKQRDNPLIILYLKVGMRSGENQTEEKEFYTKQLAAVLPAAASDYFPGNL